MPKKIELGKRKEQGIETIKEMVNDMLLQLETMSELSKILLENDNREIAIQIIDEDKYLDDLMSDITIEISNFITREQPLAQDLRIAISNLRIISELERMGDHYKEFAKFTLKAEVNSKTQNEILSQLMDITLERIVELKEIYQDFDHKRAKALAKKDNEISKLSKELVRNVEEKLTKESDIAEVKRLTRVLSLSKIFTRNSAHVVNVCEQISYVTKGQIYHYS